MADTPDLEGMLSMGGKRSEVCKVCGEPRIAERALCKEHNNERARIYYSNLGEDKRIRYGFTLCCGCGKNLKKGRPNQTHCKKCTHRSTSVHFPDGVSNKYSLTKGSGKDAFQHRVFVSGLLNRKLEAYEHIHHIDENPNNNSVHNLIVLINKDHAKLHAYLRKIRAGLEKSNLENLENCWDTLRASATTTWLETAGVKVIKMWEIGQSAAEPV